MKSTGDQLELKELTFNIRYSAPNKFSMSSEFLRNEPYPCFFKNCHARSGPTSLHHPDGESQIGRRSVMELVSLAAISMVRGISGSGLDRSGVCACASLGACPPSRKCPKPGVGGVGLGTLRRRPPRPQHPGLFPGRACAGESRRRLGRRSPGPRWWVRRMREPAREGIPSYSLCRCPSP